MQQGNGLHAIRNWNRGRVMVFFDSVQPRVQRVSPGGRNPWQCANSPTPVHTGGTSVATSAAASFGRTTSDPHCTPSVRRPLRKHRRRDRARIAGRQGRPHELSGWEDCCSRWLRVWQLLRLPRCGSRRHLGLMTVDQGRSSRFSKGSMAPGAPSQGPSGPSGIRPVPLDGIAELVAATKGADRRDRPSDRRHGERAQRLFRRCGVSAG